MLVIPAGSQHEDVVRHVEQAIANARYMREGTPLALYPPVTHHVAAGEIGKITCDVCEAECWNSRRNGCEC